jgi:UDP-glucose 4-epimerase
VAQSIIDLGDPSGANALRAVCDEADVVIHLAGESASLAEADPGAALSRTFQAAAGLTQACVQAGVSRLVYVSSVHVYGSRLEPGATVHEEMRPDPTSIYGISRLATEHVAASRSHGAYDLVILRLTNAVGAPARADGRASLLLVNDLARQGCHEGSLILRSSGLQWRDFVSLESACLAIAAAARPIEVVIPPSTYNLASGIPMTVRSMAELVQAVIAEETGRTPPLNDQRDESKPLPPYYVSTDRASRFGLRLISPIREAVTETVRFFLSHPGDDQSAKSG